MSHMFLKFLRLDKRLCCECGTQIEPNPANMCVACLRMQVDITEGIPKQGTLYFCRNCERYLQGPGSWLAAALESRELLALCLKKMKGLNKMLVLLTENQYLVFHFGVVETMKSVKNIWEPEVRLVDAGFVWTEPHSKRIKVKVTIQKEVLNGAVLQQVFVVEFVVHNQMCDECHRVEAKDFWRAVVQVRQKTSHKKTLFYLEQLILKHKAHMNTTNIKQVHEGLDFYYAQKQDARKLVEFLQQVVPCRYSTAQELISHDIRNNTYNYKFTFSVEIVPICKDNIVCLPPKMAQQLGNMSQICVAYRVTQAVHLIDPNTCQIADISGTVFWRQPFHSLCQPKQLTEFVVMNIEEISDRDRRHIAGHAQESQKHVLADVWVVKACELGMDDNQFHCRTHLGHLLNVGDSVLGFDLRYANVNDAYFEKLKTDYIPDVVLVKKLYGNSQKRNKKRKWKLQHLTNEMETDKNERDYTEFLEDLEEDAAYRQHVNIYKDSQKVAVDADDTETDDDEAPKVSLAEMLDDLHLVEDATGGEGAPMMD